MEPPPNPEFKMNMIDENPSRQIIGFPVAALPFDQQIQLMLQWAKSYLSKVVCVANVHMLMEGYQNSSFAEVLREADLLTPDGMPLVWMLKLMGVSHQDRVAGLDILDAVCQLAPSQNVSVFFLGSQQIILDSIKQRLEKEFPNLDIAGMEPLPFRALTLQEDEAIIQQINNSGAGIVFVSLGCPKQEVWMAQHKDKVKAVMIGLGGAFPVYAGLHKRAPLAIRSAGLEWLYRLAQEPQRLWRRYFDTIPLFIWLASRELLIRPRDVHPEEL
ncbi:MAG: WecB/TagA/CpsF family glycosyltransferase [Myxacorys californica WJT36-NPBG1]|jgi:N-acetylglucosaminyldiphosphoundecaprenol N-acetyl-beta-D-mannosaminyltransferase|nr:WecB/TagA/CpsF family glycosyltransferase [Myxacorys californica WJT36-NPBG1]